MRSQALRGPLARRPCDRLPRDRRLPAVYRDLARDDASSAARGELARDPALALVEAALLAADEPLNARRLASVAGLQDGNEARRLVRKLHALYERDGTAFQVEELAGGFQVLTRPAYHAWLMRWRR